MIPWYVDKVLATRLLGDLQVHLQQQSRLVGDSPSVIFVLAGALLTS